MFAKMRASYNISIFSRHITIAERPMNFSKYVATMNDRRRIKGCIFTASGVRGRFRHLSKGAFASGMGKFCRGLRRGLLRFLRLEYGWKNELRDRGGALKLFPFFFFFRVSSTLSTPLFSDCSFVVSKFLRLSL